MLKRILKLLGVVLREEHLTDFRPVGTEKGAVLFEVRRGTETLTGRIGLIQHDEWSVEVDGAELTTEQALELVSLYRPSDIVELIMYHDSEENLRREIERLKVRLFKLGVGLLVPAGTTPELARENVRSDINRLNRKLIDSGILKQRILDRYGHDKG